MWGMLGAFTRYANYDSTVSNKGGVNKSVFC